MFVMFQKLTPQKIRVLFHQNLSGFLSASRLPLPMIIAALVGIGTSFGAIGFIKSISIIEDFGRNNGIAFFHFLGPYAVLMIPVIGGLLVGLIVTFLAPEAKGHGVPQVLKAIALHGGRIRPIVVIAKAVASAIAIGTGASVGREGPIVQVGSALGSTFAQIFKMGEMRTKNLIACGAAAGVASVFNAPIAGVMFASEVILRDFGARALSTVVVAAVSASAVSRFYLGESPAFTIPTYGLASPWELFIYTGLGILAAFSSQLFVWTLHTFEDLFDRWIFPAWLKPAVGGLLVGFIGMYFPHVLGSGLEAIGEILRGNLPFQLLLLLIFIKILATSLSLGSGTSGGVFAPALFIGSVLGGTIGCLAPHYAPFPVGTPGAYAVVGMATVFAAAAHAPITAILIVFEMTGDYGIILPIMVSVIVATSLSQFLSRESIYTANLKRKGIDFGSFEDARVLGAVQVRDAMDNDYEVVQNNLSSKTLLERMLHHKNKSFLVVDLSGNLVGYIRPEEVQEVLLEHDLQMVNASDIANPLLHYCFPDEPLNEAARLMLNYNLPLLPVVDPADVHKILGVLRSDNIFKAYIQMSHHRSNQMRLADQPSSKSGSMQSAQFTIPPDAPIVGKSIKELALPPGVILASITRSGSVFAPKGNTLIQAKDTIWTVIDPKTEAAFKQWLSQSKLSLLH